MQVKAYQNCQECGQELESSTVYRQHALCESCA